jgi:septal ring factor EnvC (AmiA/AmiB activator)
MLPFGTHARPTDTTTATGPPFVFQRFWFPFEAQAHRRSQKLFQRIADHEKQYIDQLKADTLKLEEERAKQSGKASKKRTQRESINKRGR